MRHSLAMQLKNATQYHRSFLSPDGTQGQSSGSESSLVVFDRRWEGSESVRTFLGIVKGRVVCLNMPKAFALHRSTARSFAPPAR